jgi:hypothetical protein
MYWIPGRTSELSLANRLLLLHKTILKPIWTYALVGHSLSFEYRNPATIPE